MSIRETVKNDLLLLRTCTELFGEDTTFDKTTFDEVRSACNRHFTPCYLPALSTLVKHRIVVKVGEINTQHEITHKNCTVRDEDGRVIDQNVEYTQTVNGVKYLYQVNANYREEWFSLLSER